MGPGDEQSLKASVGLLIRVPRGYLRKGSRFHPRESPPQTTHVAEFEIAHVPVTVNQYKMFLDLGGAERQEWWSDPGWHWRRGKARSWGREDRSRPDRWRIQLRRLHHPVVGLCWYEAEAYCRWLSEQTKQTVRLPTEVEWERAARGDDSRPFPWGELFDPSLTNTIEANLRDTVTAGSLTGDVSPFGVLGMSGNVQEWVATEYIPTKDELFLPGPLKVVRGGSFNDTIYGARTSYRRAYPPGYFYPFLGFRVVVAHR